MVNFDVSFRYIGIKTEKGEIPAICLSYLDEESAKAAFALFHKYIKSPSGAKSMRVEFFREAMGLYSLIIDVATQGHLLNTKIAGIDSSYIKKIKESLDKFTYYVILAGYEESGTFHLLPCDEYHLFKRDIVIDGEVILGTTDCDVDWQSVLK